MRIAAVCLFSLWFSQIALAQSAPADLRLNEIQFLGTHNSYKRPMSWWARWLLGRQNPEALATLSYAHRPFVEQLNAGARKLELDVFYRPDTDRFSVGHVQAIDMNSHCVSLAHCLDQLLRWSEAHPRHLPLWVSFNAKDQMVEGLPNPAPFDERAWRRLDEIIVERLAERLLRPQPRAQWPLLADVRGKFLLILDEGSEKSVAYRQANPEPAMFVKAHDGVDRFASVAILNDPQKDQADIEKAIREGYLVRTRADADTVEARANDGRRRDAALASGAQAVSTDYLWSSQFFESSYVVQLPNNPGGAVARCNERLRAPCMVFED